ncbi:MAG TPA: segregation/condensation protein A [Candidatus Atribacteria bacterium]|nr:segregation/condensation protein A [Candidatus Atribacteria bacterium]HPT77912.1 segregation/condensation protein A [Candidatus Atribacteria bacterium]
MTYKVILEQFEGPLDLLLHLISKAKIQIEDISIAEITQQYLDVIEEMQQFDIEVASEFLVMAATLLHIKSCMLLPRQNIGADDEDVADSREDLIEKLLEYKKYKEASEQLQKREEYYSGIFTKLPEELFTSNEDVLANDITVCQLVDALTTLLRSKKHEEKKAPLVHEIRRDPVTIKERIKQLKKYFLYTESTSFSKLFEDDRTKEDIIITFLALLELLKENYIVVMQNKPFGDIAIKRRITDG